MAENSGEAPAPGLAGAPLFTLFVDASFDLRTKAAGWGAWGISPSVRGVEFSGPIDSSPKNSSEAEFIGICNALLEIALRGYLTQIHAVILQGDNLAALRQLELTASNIKRAKPKGTGANIGNGGMVWGPRSLLLGQKVTNALEGKPIWLRHVKGHESGIDGRSLVNERCDRLARREMTKVRKEREGKRNEN